MKIISNPVELAKKLASIPSESGSEGAVGEYIFEYLKELGLPAEKLEVGEGRFNVFVAGGSEVLFINHIDTVPVGEGWSADPYGEIKDWKLYGRGSCDNKGSGACLLAALAGAAKVDVDESADLPGKENLQVQKSLPGKTSREANFFRFKKTFPGKQKFPCIDPSFPLKYARSL